MKEYCDKYPTKLNWHSLKHQLDPTHKNHPLFIKDFIMEPSMFGSWEKVEEYLNNRYSKFELIKEGQKLKIKTKLDLHNEPYQLIPNLKKQIEEKNATFIIKNSVFLNKNIQSLCNELSNMCYTNAVNAKLFGSKSKQVDEFSPRLSNFPNFLFQLDGTLKIQLYKNPPPALFPKDVINKTYLPKKLIKGKTYKLNPGDFFYLPPRTFYKITSSSRLTLNVTINPNNKKTLFEKNYYYLKDSKSEVKD